MEQLGPYRLIRQSGRGAMATVYEAEDTRIGRRVAVKILTPIAFLPDEQQEERTQRLEREARAVARLSHPNVVAIHDVGVVEAGDGSHGKTPYLVMELLRGETLAERLRRLGSIPPGEAGMILEGAARGLDAVHAAGVLHRDIKPENLMLVQDAEDGSTRITGVKLMDFGIARSAEDVDLTQTGALIGSPAYLSPERVRGEPFTPAGDLWALGVVLYEMLAGIHPFTGEALHGETASAGDGGGIASLIYRVTRGEPPLPVDGLSPAVQAVLDRALAPDPAQRFPSARALSDAFREALLVSSPEVPLAAMLPAVQPVHPLRQWLWPAVPAAVAGLVVFLLGINLPRLLSPAPGQSPEAAASPGVTALTPSPKASAQKLGAAASSAQAALPVAAVKEQPKTSRSEERKATDRRAPQPPPAPRQVVAAKKPGAVVTVTERTPQREPPRKPKTIVATASQLPPGMILGRLEPEEKGTASAPSLAAAETNEEHLSERQPVPPRSELPSLPPQPEGMEGEDLSFIGEWKGMHTGKPATLTIERQRDGGNTFFGTLAIDTEAGTVQIDVRGELKDEGDVPRVTLHETRVRSAPDDSAWDLGVNTGRLSEGGDVLQGSGRDRRGRTYLWRLRRAL